MIKSTGPMSYSLGWHRMQGTIRTSFSVGGFSLNSGLFLSWNRGTTMALTTAAHDQ